MHNTARTQRAGPEPQTLSNNQYSKKTIPKHSKLHSITSSLSACRSHSALSKVKWMQLQIPYLEIRRGKRRRGSKRCKSRSSAWLSFNHVPADQLSCRGSLVSWRCGSASTGETLTSKAKSYPREITPQSEGSSAAAAAAAERADGNRASAGEAKKNTGLCLTL